MRHLLLGTAILLAACSPTSNGEDVLETPSAQESYQDTLQLALLDAQSGDVITIPAGTHSLDRGLSLTADGVTIRGEGMDVSVLSFVDQIAGAEGLLITGDDVVLENFAVEDAKGTPSRSAIRTASRSGVSGSNGPANPGLRTGLTASIPCRPPMC